MENTGNPIMIKLKSALTSRNTLKNIGGALLGLAGGFIYYKTIGCSSGGCAITSNPYMSMIWGGMLGYLLADMFRIKEAKSPAEKSGDQEA